MKFKLLVSFLWIMYFQGCLIFEGVQSYNTNEFSCIKCYSDKGSAGASHCIDEHFQESECCDNKYT